MSLKWWVPSCCVVLLVFVSCTQPGLDNASQSSLTSTSTSACQKPSRSLFVVRPTEYEWKQSGIGDPQEAAAWDNCGFTPRDAYIAKTLGLTPDSIAPWINNGFRLSADESQNDQIVDLAARINGGQTPSDATTWSSQGFDYTETADWNAAGVDTPSEAEQWIGLLRDFPSRLSVDPGDSDQELIKYNQGIIPSIQSLKEAGITADQTRQYLADGLDISNSDSVTSFIPFFQNGTSFEKAKFYVQNGVPVDQVNQFETVLNEYCGGSIDDESQLTSGNPYTISGHCFMIEGMNVSQWLGSTSALVNANSTEVEFGEPPLGARVPNALVVGKTPFIYSSANAGTKTVPAVKVLLLVDPE